MSLKVKFSQATPTLTVRTSAPATKLDNLTDVDSSSDEARQAGTTLVYDSNTNAYKTEKVFDYDGDEVTLKGGTF